MSESGTETEWTLHLAPEGGNGAPNGGGPPAALDRGSEPAAPLGLSEAPGRERGRIESLRRFRAPQRGRAVAGAAPSYLIEAPATVFEAPSGPATVVVAAVGEAEGSRGAAAALACAGAAVDVATLLVEVGGRPPRPTLIASSAARRLEERLASNLPHLRAAARGEVCHAAVAADEGGLAAAYAAVAVTRAGGSVVHVETEMLQPLLAADVAPRPSAVLLRADLDRDRPLVALAVADLLGRDLRVGVLKRRLGWVAERRAKFGALGAEGGGLPEPLVRRLLG